MDVVAEITAVVLAGVFLVAAVTKLASPGVWRAQASELGVPSPIVAVLPIIEACLGAVLLVQWQRRAAAVVALALLIAFTMLLVIRLSQGRRPPCACFGSFSATPIGWHHVVRNLVFAALAVIVLAAG